MDPDDLRLGALALAGRLQAALADAQAAGGSAWRRGWILAAMGRYGEALEELDAAEKGTAVVAAAACGTRASVLREVGLHTRAETEDRRGVAYLQQGGDPQGKSCQEVRAGLRIGLVADGVGLGLDRGELDRDLRAAIEAVAAGGSTRQQVRLDRVTGEVALAAGEAVVAATWYQRARRRAVDHGLARHEAGSLVRLAGANAAAGTYEQAAALAAEGLELATRCGAEPLRWQALLLLDEASGDLRHRCAAAGVLGSLLAHLPPDLHAEARTRPPAAALLHS